MLCDSEEDYTIYRVTCPKGIVQLNNGTMDAASNSYGYVGDAKDSTCLMRYGIMNYGQNPTFQSTFIESDNILNLGAKRSNYSGSWANCYNGNYRM